MLKPIVYRLGQNPKQSLKRFFIGLGLFLLAVFFITLGYYLQAWIQVIGLLILIPALFFAGWGYLGIFANRFSQVIAAINPAAEPDDNDKLK